MWSLKSYYLLEYTFVLFLDKNFLNDFFLFYFFILPALLYTALQILQPFTFQETILNWISIS